jgi:hypothetical protein
MPGKLKMWCGALSLVFLLASCASTAHIEKDDNADFSRYKSFAWIDKDGEGKADQNVRNDFMEQQVKDAVTRELERSAGWNESKNKPDVLLSYDVLVEKNTEQRNDPVYSEPYTRTVYNPYTRRYATIYYPSQFLGYDRRERTVREGTVTITMIDAKTDKLVWQGWTTDQVNSRNLTKKEIDNSVRAIFRKFDIAKN